MAESPQQVSVLFPLMVALITTLATILVHAIPVSAVGHFVRREYQRGRAGVRFWRDVGIVTGATVVALTAHLVEVAIWAVVLVRCGEFRRFGAAFDHSAVNYTTLGYGDIVMSASWKVLGPLEAANGMLMFGISTALIFAVILWLFETRFGASADGAAPNSGARVVPAPRRSLEIECERPSTRHV